MMKKALAYIETGCAVALALIQILGCDNLWWYPSDLAGIVRFVGCIAIGAGILLKRPTIEFIGSCTFILSALISTVTVIIVFGRDFRFIYVVPELLAVLSFAAYSVTLRFRRIQFLCGVSVAAMIMSAAIKIAMIDIYLTSTFILALSLFSAIFVTSGIRLSEGKAPTNGKKGTIPLGKSSMERIAELKNLLDAGLITDAEFAKKKQDILDTITDR